MLKETHRRDFLKRMRICPTGVIKPIRENPVMEVMEAGDNTWKVRGDGRGYLYKEERFMMENEVRDKARE